MLPVLFDKTAQDFSTEGLGRLADAISCTVREKLNGYRAEAARQKKERERAKAQTLDPKASEAVRNAVKSVSGKKAPGKDR